MHLNDPTLLRQAALIDGVWSPSDDGRAFPVTNPANGDEVATVPAMGVAETRRAIGAAERAGPGWRGLTASERAAILRRWRDLMLGAQEDLARVMTAEQGKPLAEARGEIAYAASYLEWFAEEARRIYGELIPSDRPDRRLLVMRQPIGVCAAITPWNFPVAMLARKAAAALAAGCTLVAKPAEEAPLSALAFAALAERAGLPPGVLNVLTGAPEAIGGEMTANPVVRKLSFTGSTEVGRLLMRQCASTVKRLSLELGGNAPFIVFDDADLEAAVEGAIQSKYRNAGQTCVCANRILVQSGIHDVFAERLAARVLDLKVGVGTDPEVALGPLIDEKALAKVEAQVADALAGGARLLTGGRRHPLGRTFYEPTVLAGATATMRLAREETFGPLAPIFRFETEDEAVAMANDTDFGLAAYFYTRDLGRAFRVSEALEYGMVGLNTGLVSTAIAPFGGIKHSGFGREGARQGIEEYLQTKYLCLGL